MPSAILQRDYVTAEQLSGGWLDLQEMLRGILYQGGLAISPLQRLANIEKKALELLRKDPDDSLFCLFQALADNSLGYCATHALLCSVVCELTAQKVGIDSLQRQSLMNAALTMNIGMARDQDSLTRQSADPTDWQRTLIQEHPQKSAEILSGFDVDDADQIDIVRWHHDPDSPEAAPRTLASRRILAMADSFVAKMAARKSRASLSPVKAVKSMVMGASGDAVGVGSAMAQAAGFYPPGSYVMLVNGETAAALGGTLVYGGSSQGATGLGNYVIAPSGLAATNYSISYDSGALNIVSPPPRASGAQGAITIVQQSGGNGQGGIGGGTNGGGPNGPKSNQGGGAGGGFNSVGGGLLRTFGSGVNLPEGVE